MASQFKESNESKLQLAKEAIIKKEHFKQENSNKIKQAKSAIENMKTF